MRFRITILSILLISTLCQSQTINSWQTKISDGDTKRADMGNWSDTALYNINQDSNYTLFKKQSISLQPSRPKQKYRIIIKPNRTFQQMQGYGASMTDASAYVLMQLKEKNPALYDYTMKKLFDTTDGAGFSFLRKPLGSSDYTATQNYYTYCDQKSPDLALFSIDHDKKYIIPALKETLRYNPSIKIMGSPWSPPAWMKTNENLIGITKDEKEAGKICKLKPEYFETYAEYFVKIIEAYKNEGIDIYAVTLQNEPQFDAARYPCMRMDANDQIKLISFLGPKLKQKNLNTKIFIHDHNWQLHPDDRPVICGDTKADPVDLCHTILNDPQAGQYAAGTAWHCYSGGTDAMKQAYKTMHKEFPDKLIFCTEISGWGRNRGQWFGDINWTMQHNWMGGPQNFASVSLQWNLALDHKFGPTLRDDSAAMGIITINTDTYKEVKFEREYYAMAQLSRAAQPGCVRIQTQAKSTDPNPEKLDTIAFKTADGKISLVVYNSNPKPHGFLVECSRKYFVYNIPGQSIATFIWPE